MIAAGAGYRRLTSGGVIAALVLAGGHIASIASGGLPWRGDFLWGVQQLGEPVLLLIPVILVLATAPVVARGGVSADEALLPVSPTRAAVLRWQSEALPLLAVQTVALLTVLGITLAHGSTLPGAAAWTIAQQLVTLAVLPALGQLIGRGLRHLAATVVAGLVGILLVGFAADTFRLDAGSSPYAGLTLVTGPYLLSFLVLAASLATMMALLVWGPGRRLLVGGAVAVTLTLLSSGAALSSPRTEPTSDQPQVCSQEAGLEVCVFDGYERMLDPTAKALGRYTGALAKADVDPRIGEIVQATPGIEVGPAGRGRVQFQSDELATGSVAGGTALTALLTPVWCERIYSSRPPSDASSQRTNLVATWLEYNTGRLDERTFKELAPRLAAQPPVAQAAFAQRFFDDLAACKGLG